MKCRLSTPPHPLRGKRSTTRALRKASRKAPARAPRASSPPGLQPRPAPPKRREVKRTPGSKQKRRRNLFSHFLFSSTATRQNEDQEELVSRRTPSSSYQWKEPVSTHLRLNGPTVNLQQTASHSRTKAPSETPKNNGRDIAPLLPHPVCIINTTQI